MAPAEQSIIVNEAPSMLENIKRSATVPVVFAFFINPPLSWAFFWFLIARNVGNQPEPYLVRIYLTMGYALASMLFIPAWAFNHEIERLEKLGFTIQPTRFPGRRLDWGLNVAVCGVLCWYGQRPDVDTTWTNVLLLIGGMWAGMILLFVGRIWYFAADAPVARAVQT